MSDINFSKLTWENLPARTTALSATNLNRIEKGIDDSVNGVNSNSHSIAELQTRISQVASGTPEPVNTIAEMTDHSKIYVYTGSEQGESTGYWYRYDSTQEKFVPGGQYGGAVTSTTFNQHGVPADAKAVGDALALKADADDVTALAEDIAELQDGGYVADQQKITEKINGWLEEHPEATTTVQDNSITLAKLSDNSVDTSKIKNESVTREKLSDDLQEKITWYKIDNLNQLGLVKELSISGITEQEYEEDITYIPRKNLFYIGMSDGSVITINPETWETVNTYTPSFDDAIASIDYSGKNDVVIVSTGSSVYFCNTDTMEIISTVINSGKVFYDDVTEKYVCISSTANNIAHIVFYDDNFVQTGDVDINFDATQLTQGGCAHGGVIYSANYNNIVELDYLHNRSHVANLIGSVTGADEVEGFCIYADALHVLSHVWTYRTVRLYSIQCTSWDNMGTTYSNNYATRRTYSLAGGIEINAGDNLNNYTEVGNYYCSSDQVASSLLNCPIQTAFSLKISLSLGVGSYRTQTLESYQSPYNVYKRVIHGSTVGDWVKVTGNIGKIETNIDTLQYRQLFVPANGTVNITMTSRVMLVIAYRSDARVEILDYYDANSLSIFSKGSPRISITKPAQSYEVTITNLMDSSTPILILN